MTRKTMCCILLCLTALCAAAPAQESKALLDAYLRNFEKGGPDAKLRVIEDASALNNPELAPLFKRAVEFAVTVSERGKNESLIRQFSMLATEQCERYQHTDARTVVWRLFLLDQDSNVSMKTLKALGAIARGDAQIVKSLNEWLADRVTAYKANRTPRHNVIIRCVMTLGELNDESSFPVVFNVMHAGLSQEIDAVCRQVLSQMKGDFKPLLLALIADGTIREKREAFLVALESAFLSDEVKGEIAEIALKKALSLSSPEKIDQKDIREIKVRANRALGVRRRGSATPLVIQYFDEILNEYDRKLTGKPELIEIIRTLGDVGTHEAAQRLTVYLEFLNTYTDQKKVYEELIVFETIESLGRLADKVAFDVLMNVKFLNYSANIKTSADAAIKSLKW